MSSQVQVPILPDRACNQCTLCCKVLRIEELAKAPGEWCKHCAVSRGCRIYEARPSECRTFHCGYLIWPGTGEHWFPARCKMVIASAADGTYIAIHVDPSRPHAWRDQPYYDEIKGWARAAAPKMIQVMIRVGGRTIVILPDADVDLGHVADGEIILTRQVTVNGRRQWEALKVQADDPRLAAVAGRSVTLPGQSPGT